MTFLDFYRSSDGRRVLLYQTVVLAASAVALSAALGDGRLDLTVSRWFFDEARHTFPLTNHWLLKTLLHDVARTASTVTLLALLGLTLTSWVAQQSRALRGHREALLFTSIATLASVAIVGALKHFSSHACPWDLAVFGGSAVFHPLFGAHVSNPGVAGCFPAAHPLAGYAWLAVGFALYPSARRRTWQLWGLALCLGTLFGATQIVRGAHFLSHVLWSAWIVWAVNVATLAAMVVGTGLATAFERRGGPTRAHEEPCCHRSPSPVPTRSAPVPRRGVDGRSRVDATDCDGARAKRGNVCAARSDARPDPRGAGDS